MRSSMISKQSPSLSLQTSTSSSSVTTSWPPWVRPYGNTSTCHPFHSAWKPLQTNDLRLSRSWSTKHPKIWLNVAIVRAKVLKYSQFHVDNTTSKALKASGLPIAEFDGGVDIWAKTNEDLMSVSVFIILSRVCAAVLVRGEERENLSWR